MMHTHATTLPAPRPHDYAWNLELPVVALHPYGTVPTLDDVVDLAGPNAVRLTELSRRLGTGHHLVFASDTRTVFWADEQPSGRWLAEELDAEEVLLRVPVHCGQQAPHEYRLLLRAALEERSSALPAQIDQLIGDLQARLAHLIAVRDELLPAS